MTNGSRTREHEGSSSRARDHERSSPRAALDAAVQRLGKRAIDALPWGVPALARVREAALSEVLDRRRADVLRGRDLCQSPDGLDELERLAGGLLDDLRSGARDKAAPSRRLALEARLDEWVHADVPEWMDDPSFDARRRVSALRALDRGHRLSGGYVRFFELLAPLLAGEGPITVLDVASGHAGFAAAVAGRLRGERRVRVIASDLRPEYMEIGAGRARAAGVDNLETRTVDALRLDETWGSEPIDVVTCSLALHHFPPGRVVRLLAQAIGRARRGVLMIDLVRGMRALVVGATSTLLLGDRTLHHDAVASVRRAYTAEELRLLAHLAPGGERLEALSLPQDQVALRSRTEDRC